MFVAAAARVGLATELLSSGEGFLLVPLYLMMLGLTMAEAAGHFLAGVAALTDRPLARTGQWVMCSGVAAVPFVIGAVPANAAAGASPSGSAPHGNRSCSVGFCPSSALCSPRTDSLGRRHGRYLRSATKPRNNPTRNTMTAMINAHFSALTTRPTTPRAIASRINSSAAPKTKPLLIAVSVGISGCPGQDTRAASPDFTGGEQRGG